MEVWEQGRESLSSDDCFVELSSKVFKHTSEGKEIGEQLLAVKQGKRNTAGYAMELHTLAAGSG